MYSSTYVKDAIKMWSKKNVVAHSFDEPRKEKPFVVVFYAFIFQSKLVTIYNYIIYHANSLKETIQI